MFGLVYPPSPAPLYPRPSVDHPGVKMRSESEMLPLIDEFGLVYGQASRTYCHSGAKVLHPVVHLHLIDRYSRIFLQKRSASKDLYPRYWDTAVGGHVTYGETLEEALYREASEELGLSEFNPVPLGTYIYETDRDREFVAMFAAVGHPDISPSNPEVDEGRWWTIPEIEASTGKRLITPNFEQEFPRIKKQLLSLL